MGIDNPLGRPAVFLDRDGVINRAIVKGGRPYPPQTVDAVEILPGVAAAVSQLRAAGFEIVVVTNQPDVARGKQTKAEVEAINGLLGAEVGIGHFNVCYHDDRDACECRKPKPGLILDAARELSLDLGRSFMVGDRWRDIEAGRAAGVKTVWLDYGYDEKRPDAFDLRTDSLINAAEWISSRQS